MRHFLSVTDLDSKEIFSILALAGKLKKISLRQQKLLLANKSMAMIFEKPSLRTRVSFEVGMTQMGGHAIYLAPSDIGLGKRETIKDTAKVLSRMVDIIMARTFEHETVVELAKYSMVPVINALTDLEHPCQVLADLLTIKEKVGEFKGLNLAFIGDGENNVTHSLALASALLGINFRVASPKGYLMLRSIYRKALQISKKTGAEIFETSNIEDAVRGANVVYTDTWVSMGDESQKEKRVKDFRGYQVNKKLMGLAKKDAIFMHDMPAYRGFEVSPEVIDGGQSVIIDQAENRLHAQKALICFLVQTQKRGKMH